MDFESWITAVKDCKDNATVLSLFKTFADSVAEAKRVDYFDLKQLLSVFSKAAKDVTDEGQAVLLDAMRLFIQFADHDAEIYLKDSLQWVVACCLDFKVAINKAAKKCLQTYLIKTRNIDEVMRILVENGLQSKNVAPVDSVRY